MRSARLGARGVSSEALALAAVFSVALLSGCGGGPSEGVIRLIDEFREDMVQGTPTKIAPVDTTGSWNFGEIEEGAPAMLGWKAGVGVSGFEVRDGSLRGMIRQHPIPRMQALRAESASVLLPCDLTDSRQRADGALADLVYVC